MGAVAEAAAFGQDRAADVPPSHAEQAALRWRIEREARRRRTYVWALAATPLLALAVYVLAGIPLALLRPDEAVPNQTVMVLAALLGATVHGGLCMAGRLRAGRRLDESRERLFMLGGHAATATPASTGTRSRASAGGRPRAFIVHGRDEAALNEVARFVDRLGIEPVVLRELPSGGRTIIEKFEELAEVDCAVVLLTPDDRGGLAHEPFDQQRPRARQNVLLELGFFLGRLGRGRVCVLYRPSVEIPSDYGGVLFVELDGKGAWKLPLAGELREAGLEVDLDQIFGAKTSRVA